MTNPANDPIGTVRIHPDHERENPSSLRRIKADASDSAGPYVGCHWGRLTFHPLSPTLGAGTDPVSDDDVADWPVQPIIEVARVLGHPDPLFAPLCNLTEVVEKAAQQKRDELLGIVKPADVKPYGVLDGSPKYAPVALAVVDAMRPEWDPNDNWDNSIEGPLLRTIVRVLNEHLPPAPVPVEDTDTPATCVCGDPSTKDMLHRLDGPCWHYGGPVAAPSTVDNSARERIVEILARADGYHSTEQAYDEDQQPEWFDDMADEILAALSELAELGKLRAELGELQRSHGCACHNPNGGMFTWPCPQHSERVILANEVKTLRAKLTERNRAYGKASATIGRLRDQLAAKRYASVRAENDRLKGRVLDEARAHSTLANTLGQVIAERQRPHFGARVEVTTSDGTKYLGRVGGYNQVSPHESRFAITVAIIVCDDMSMRVAPVNLLKVIAP